MTDHNYDENILQQDDSRVDLNNNTIPTDEINRDALLSFVFSMASLVLGLFTFGVLSILAVPGVVLAHIALKNMQPNEKGGGFALAGLIIGYVIISIVVLGILLFTLFVHYFGELGSV
jgi:hypothetical protein